MDMDNTKLQVLSAHYTHTFDFLQSHLKKRDRLFLCVLIILIVMLFQLYTPQEASNFISQLITNKFKLSTAINFLYIQSIIWFVLLAVIVKYFQSVVFIERQYNYIHSLEKLLSKEYEKKAFTREGESYLKDYPLFLNWASFLYTMLFPAILITVIFGKIISEFKQFGFAQILIWFNFLIFLFLVVSICLYMYVIHFKKETK
ncbi:hypothetical protein LCGC14_2229480 [marine sediment metagenome]|uniref:Uncharacterized protein n=1 Tax=marine sediment metagenome TaxID=412755 RepID=A0A0F9FL85_9ZZZZ